MDKKQRDQLQEALKDVSEVLMFENWLRFYFIVEEKDKLFLRVPEKARDLIREKHEHLAGLVELLNDEEMDYQKSYESVCGFVASHLDGSKHQPGVCEGVLNSKAFKMEMQLFNLWVQAHEDQLDSTFVDFETWTQLFWDWKRSDEVKEYLKEFKSQLLKVGKPASGTVQ